MEYRTVYQGGKGEIVEKKSRFIAEVFLVHSEEEAMQYLEQIRKKYWDATVSYTHLDVYKRQPPMTTPQKVIVMCEM